MQKIFIVFQLVRYIATTTATIEPNMSNKKNNDLISKGKLFDIQQYPFIVYLEATNSNGQIGACTGSLISPLFVLTAAHCTDTVDRDNIIVYRFINSDTKFRRYVEHIYQHPLYDTNKYSDDISILKLEYPFRDVSHFIDLSGHPDEFSNATSLNCTAIGYGMTENSSNMERLGYMTNLTVVHGYRECHTRADYELESMWEKLLCSKPNIQSICPGDSGGPLICNEKQYGVADFVYNNLQEEGISCGNPNLQSGYLFVHYYRDWISNIVLNSGNLLQLHNKLFNISIILIVYSF